MPLPHFTQLIVNSPPGGPGTLPQEPIYLNLFEVTFVLPQILQADQRDPILFLQQAQSIDLGLTNKDIQTSTQRWKYTSRVYLNAGPAETHIDNLTITFNVNQNENGSMETWAALRSWYDLAWNSQNGYLHYKADCIGTIVVNQHDKKGLVLRRVTFNNCQLKSLTSPNMSYANQAIMEPATAIFACDYWVDEYIDSGKLPISPAFVDGY